MSKALKKSTRDKGFLEQYEFSIEWFKADPDLHKFIEEQARHHTTKQDYIHSVFTSLMQYGFVTVKPMTPELLASLSQHIKFQEEKNGRE